MSAQTAARRKDMTDAAASGGAEPEKKRRKVGVSRCHRFLVGWMRTADDSMTQTKKACECRLALWETWMGLIN